MASDSRCSDEHDTHVTSTKKVYRLSNGALYGYAGDSDDRDLRALLSKSTPRKMPTRAQLATLKTDAKVIVVFPKGQCYTIEIEFDKEKTNDWVASVDLITDEIVAVGSGYQFAMGAMEAGKSPAEAVRIACRRDLACAPPVQWEPLDRKKVRPPA